MLILKKLNRKEETIGRRIFYFLLFLFLLIVLKGLLIYIYYVLSLNAYQATTDVTVSQTVIILVTCVLGPICEEVIYRLPLRFNMLFVRVSIFLFLVINIFRYESGRMFLETGPFFRPRIFIFVVLASVCIFLSYQKAASEKLEKLWKDKFLWILVITQVVFGIMHLRQFDFDISGSSRHIPLIVAIFFAMGIYYAVIRMKLGIIAAIIFHMLFNSFYLFVDVATLLQRVRDPYGRLEKSVLEKERHHMDSAYKAMKRRADSLQQRVDSLRNSR